MMQPKPGSCRLSPRGWYCNLDTGHDGPCPTWPRWWNFKWQYRMTLWRLT